MQKLFDESSGLLLLDEIAFQSPSYQTILEDNVVTDSEIMEQAGRVVDLFRKIDRQLSAQDKELVLKAITELAVLYQTNAIKGGKRDGNF